ncbi:MAG: PAS domain-containing sensor histidine kinase, partial [Pseudomonadota bacterium]
AVVVQKDTQKKAAKKSGAVRGRLGLAIGALLVLEGAALGIKAWEERQTSDLRSLESLQREAIGLSQRIQSEADTVISTISLGQRSGAARELVTSAIAHVDVVLSLRDAAASPEGSRLKSGADAALVAIASDETLGMSSNGDLIFIVEETGFPTAIAFARAEAWLPAAASGRRHTLVGNYRLGVGDMSLEQQANSASIDQPRIQSGEGLLRSATACASLSGSELRACVTRPSPLFTRDEILRLITYGLLLAAPLLAILGLINMIVTSRKERDSASSQAHSAQERLDLVMSGARAGSWTWSSETQTANFSPMAAELIGLNSEGQYALETFLPLIMEKDQSAVRDALMEASTKQYLQVSFSTATDEDQQFVEMRASVHEDGEEGTLRGIVMDVTGHKKSDLRLRMAERRLRNAIEGFAGPFALWDNRQRLLYWNRSFSTTFGLEDILRPGISHDTVELAKASAIRRVQKEDSDDKTQYIELHSERWLKIVERPTNDDGLITLAIDVTENRRNENQLKDQRRKLKTVITKLERSEGQASELASKYQEEKKKAEHAANTKSAFLANMSHELRTPLNAINGFSEILIEELYGPLGDEKYKAYAADILASGQHLLDLINDILDMAKIEAGKMTVTLAPLDPIDPVDAAVRMMRQKVEAKGISLILDVPTDLPDIEADHRAIRQMVLNLISNAMKFTDKDGRITVAVRRHDEQIRISVIDTGIGIPREEIARLGKPFEQISDTKDRNFEGTGLGLALTKSYADMHGGRLGIASELGKGTRVSIYLPISGQGLGVHSTDIMPAAE